MLIDFFYTLRSAKLPVSVHELLSLLEALKAGVVGPNGDPAMTGEGAWKIDDFYFLTVEKKFPYLAHCHKLSRAALDYGLGVVDRMLPLIKEAHETDTWLTGWPDETELDLPSWIQESA